MKKAALVFLVVVLILSLASTTQATSFSTSISGARNIDAGQTFSVDLNANSNTGLYGISARLTYDSNLLELVSSSGKSGFALTVGANVVADAASPKSGSFTFGTLTFKAKSSFSPGDSTSISLSRVEGSDGASTLSGSGSSRTISVKVPAAPKSSNNNLSSLAISPGTIAFDKSKTSYSTIVDNSVSSINISAKAEDAKASISGTGSKRLNIYSNTFSIVVTAENGSKKTYSVTIVRKDENGRTAPLSQNANLASLIVEGYDIKFNPDTLEYNLEVENYVSSIAVKAAAEDDKAKVNISRSDSLEVGLNPITINVTAESGDKKNYMLNVNRSERAPVVKILELSEALKTISTEEIIVVSDESGILDEDTVKALSESGKVLIVQSKDEHGNTLYEWVIDGSKIKDINTIYTKINFTSNNQSRIVELANHAKGIILSFSHNESLPSGTTVRVFVGNEYEDGDLVNLYYYNENEDRLELKQGHMKDGKVYTELVVTKGFVSISLSHTSEYILTKASFYGANVVESNTSIYMYISIFQMAVIIALVVYITRKRFHKPQVN